MERDSDYVVAPLAGLATLLAGVVLFGRLTGCGEGSWIGEALASVVAVVGACPLAAAVGGYVLAMRYAPHGSYLLLLLAVPTGALLGTYMGLALIGCLDELWLTSAAGILSTGQLIAAVTVGTLVGAGLGTAVGRYRRW